MTSTGSSRKFKPYQKASYAFVEKKQGCAGLFLSPGTGKTLIAIRYARRFRQILVLCRRDDFLTWQNELTAEGETSIGLLPKNRKKVISQALNCKWVLCTYSISRSDAVLKALSSRGFPIVIADESHMIKNPKAKQTKAVLKIANNSRRRIAMSGSPMVELENIWAQAKFIDNGYTFGAKYWNFLNRYFVRQPHLPVWFPKRGSKELIRTQLKRIAVHVHEDDVLKFPPIRRMVKGAEMTPAQKRHYKSIVERWDYELSTGVVEIDHVIVQLAKLRQVSSGFLYSEGKVEEFPSGKMKLLLDLIENELNGKKVVVWCAFIHEIRMIEKELKRLRIQSVTHYGDDPALKKRARIKFSQDKSVRVFIGQADTGVGMNELVVADTAVYYSNSLRAVSRQQSERRIRRIGSEQHKAILYIDLLTEGSIDEQIHDVIGQGRDFVKYMLDSIRLRNNTNAISQV